MELRFHENNNDYLVYGIDEAFLRRNPTCIEWVTVRFTKPSRNEVLIIQAHPFRDENSTVFWTACTA
jgi:hypothetical protein